MHLKLGGLAAYLVFCGTIFAHDGLLRAADNSLIDFMLRSRTLSNQNPQRSLACFDYYIPLLNEITATYEKDYAACIKAEQTSQSQVDADNRSERLGLQAAAGDTCNDVSLCQQQNNSLKYFDCFITQTALSSKLMFTLSQNASDVLINVRERYRQNENEKYRCTNATERTYVTDTASTYEALQHCLQGLASVPVPVPTTTTLQPAVKAVIPTTTTPLSVSTTTRVNSSREFVGFKLENDVESASMLLPSTGF